MEENTTNAPPRPPHQNPNHQQDNPHHQHHNHSHHNDVNDNDNHDDDYDDKVIDIVGVPKKPSHGNDNDNDDHDHDNIIDLESPTKPRRHDDHEHSHDDAAAANDVQLASSTKLRHGDDHHHNHDGGDDLESPAKATHDDDDDDDDVVDLESTMKSEGGCNSLMVVDSRFCSSTAMDLVIAGNGRFRCTQYTIAKDANHNDNHDHDDSDNHNDSDNDNRDDSGNDSDQKELLFRLDQRGCPLILMDKLFMVDHTNHPVLSIKRKVKGFLKNERQVFRGDEFKDGGELFCIRRSKFLQIKTSLDVYLQTNINQDDHDETIQKHIQHPSPNYVVKVSWFGSSIDMFHGSKAIAQVRRKSTGWLGKKTFCCSLQPEVDYSFVVAMTIIADSIYKEYTIGIFTAIINVLVSISDFLPSIA